MQKASLKEPRIAIFQVEPEIFNTARNRSKGFRGTGEQPNFTHNGQIGGKDLFLGQFGPRSHESVAPGNLIEFQSKVIRRERILGRLPASDGYVDVKIEQKAVSLQNRIKIGQTTGITGQPLVT